MLRHSSVLPTSFARLEGAIDDSTILRLPTVISVWMEGGRDPRAAFADALGSCDTVDARANDLFRIETRPDRAESGLILAQQFAGGLLT